MPLDQVQTAVQSFLATEWTATDIAYENDGYQLKDDGNGALIPYVLIEVFGGLYEQRSIGAGSAVANLWTDTGTVWAHVFVGSGTGSLVAKGYGATLAELFRGLTLDPNISFGDITMGASGTRQDGNYWGLSISIDWEQG